MKITLELFGIINNRVDYKRALSLILSILTVSVTTVFISAKLLVSYVEQIDILHIIRILTYPFFLWISIIITNRLIGIKSGFILAIISGLIYALISIIPALIFSQFEYLELLKLFVFPAFLILFILTFELFFKNRFLVLLLGYFFTDSFQRLVNILITKGDYDLKIRLSTWIGTIIGSALTALIIVGVVWILYKMFRIPIERKKTSPHNTEL